MCGWSLSDGLTMRIPHAQTFFNQLSNLSGCTGPPLRYYVLLWYASTHFLGTRDFILSHTYIKLATTWQQTAFFSLEACPLRTYDSVRRKNQDIFPMYYVVSSPLADQIAIRDLQVSWYYVSWRVYGVPHSVSIYRHLRSLIFCDTDKKNGLR